MYILIIAVTLQTLGKILIALAVLGVHSHIVKEHKIDEIVLKTMRRERVLSVFAIIFIIIGYVMELYFYWLFPNVPIV